MTENLRPSRPEWASPITVGLGIPYSFASPVALGTRACPAAPPPTGWKWIKPAAGPTGRARPAQEYCEPTMKEPTFGVKWKLAGSLGLLLALAIAILAWLLPTSLRDQLTHTLGAAADSHAQAVRVLLRQQDAQLRQWADWLPERQGAATALRDGDGDALQSILDHLGPEARAGLDLGSAQLLDREGRVLAHWTDGLGIPSIPAGWLERLLQDRRPLGSLVCEDVCREMGAFPLRVDGEVRAVLVASLSIKPLVTRFRDMTGLELEILLGARPQGSTDALVEPWGLAWTRHSDSERQLSLLRQAARQFPLSVAGREILLMEAEGRHYWLRLFPLTDLSSLQGGYLAISGDLTETWQRIEEEVRLGMQTGGLAMLSLTLILFLGWSRTTARLGRVLAALGDLGRGQGVSARQPFGAPRTGRLVRDEIDQLNDTLLDLADQWQTLEHKVREQATALKLRMRELDRERNFVSSLLDTAKVLVLTLDPQGRVALANQHAVKLTGFDPEDLLGRHFFDLLAPDAAAGAAGLTQLLDGKIRGHAHEGELTGATGRQLHIAWVHSRLDQIDAPGTSVLSVGLDITERKHSELRFAWLADHDPLTGLVNRRRFEWACQQAQQHELARPGSGGALLYLDLDQFKAINDTSGHRAGDQLLETFAGHLARLGGQIALAHPTLVARLGGDEFAVLVERVDRHQALAAAEQLGDGLNRLEYRVGAELYRISCCIGVALYPDHGLGFQELMQNADFAMYQAKARGEGRVQLFGGGDQIQSRMARRLRWKERIQEALEGERFFLQLQPVLEIASGRIRHWEALVRMRDTQDPAPLSPREFIPVAEATGQIAAIDCRVLDLAFDVWRRLAPGQEVAGLHLNLSVRSLHSPEWQEHLYRLLDREDADPAAFQFEISETAAMLDLKDAQLLMNGVRARGCQFALDNFGVGFSSFSHLKDLPVDLIKIDGAFISRLASQPDQQIIVKALVEAARGFGKRTLAEFVDSPETLELLRGLKVDYAQGYQVGLPQTLAQLEAAGILQAESRNRD